MKEELESEWGSSCRIRFADASQCIMRDEDGNLILCRCGKPAGAAVMGKNSYAAWCSECSLLNKLPFKSLDQD
jgi:hypothetical protein